MSLLRRRNQEATAPQASKTDKDAEPQGPSQVERSLEALAIRMDDAVTRLESLEARVTDLAEMVANAPSHSDVLEVRLHSAKLAAELARATVELRGEIGMASDEARRAARLASSNDYETGEVPVVLPVDLDLTKMTPVEDKPKSKARKPRKSA